MGRSIFVFAKRAFKNNNTLKTKMSLVSFFIAVCFIFGYIGIMMGLVRSYFVDDNDYNYRVIVVNASDEVYSFIYSNRWIPEDDISYRTWDSPYDFMTFSDMLEEEDAGALVYFPEEWSSDPENPNEALIYYRTDKLYYGEEKEFIEDFLTNDFNNYLTEKYNLTNLSISPSEISYNAVPVSGDGMIFYPVAMILPLLVFIFSLYAAMSGGTNIIAGEKERGTFAGIIMTPCRRSSIILGNFLGVFLLALIPAVVITGGGMLLMRISDPGLYIAAVLLTVSFAAFITSLALLTSVTNHTVVSAQTAFLPIFLVLLIIAVSCIQKIGDSENYYNFIPVYGHFFGIGNILTYNVIPGGLSSTAPLSDSIICSGITLVLTALILYICTRLLYVEKFITVSEGITLKDVARAKLSKKKRLHVGFLVEQAFYPVIVLSVFQTLAMIPAAVSAMGNSSYSDFIMSLKDVDSVSELFDIMSDILAAFLSSPVFLISMALGYVLLIACYALRLYHRESQLHPFESLGFSRKTPAVCYLKGLLIGFGMLTFVYLALLVTGVLSFDGFALEADGIPVLLLSVIMWITQGAAEEVMFRGFMINQVKRRTNIKFAVAFSSLMFALLHGANIGFTALAGINLFLLAVLFALIYLYSDSLQVTCGMHTAWNFCQGTLYGLQVSGSVSGVRILASHYTDISKCWLTGGDFGPEGSIFVTVAAVMGISVMTVLFRKKKASE